jgi:hypothetical protein
MRTTFAVMLAVAIQPRGEWLDTARTVLDFTEAADHIAEVSRELYRRA